MRGMMYVLEVSRRRTARIWEGRCWRGLNENIGSDWNSRGVKKRVAEYRSRCEQILRRWTTEAGDWHGSRRVAKWQRLLTSWASFWSCLCGVISSSGTVRRLVADGSGLLPFCWGKRCIEKKITNTWIKLNIRRDGIKTIETRMRHSGRYANNKD